MAGWVREVLFVLERGLAGTVTIGGGSVHGRAPPWLDALVRSDYLEASWPGGKWRIIFAADR